jgi:acetylglutamate kinase
VGTVRAVNPQIIDTLTHKGFIPVIAPVGVGEGGETFNINADLVAAKTAAALSAGRLIFLTDVDGVKDDRDRLISSVTVERIRRMIVEATVTGGMIPKIECAADAMEGGVEKVHILNGRIRHVLLLELFTDSGIGTEVTR